MEDIFKEISFTKVFWSAAFIATTCILWFIINKFKRKANGIIESQKKDIVKREATISAVTNAIKILLSVFCVFAVLQINGINVTSLVAGLGIAGAVAAVAVQDVIKDLVQGIRIYTDGFYSAGDCVVYDGEDYQITECTLRYTKMKSLINNDIRIVCNRNIVDIKKISGTVILNIPLSYSLAVEKAEEVLTWCAEEIGKIKGISKSKYLGLKSYEESSVIYIISITTKPVDRYAMRRSALKLIKNKLDKEGIEIPFNQLDVHNK